MNKLSERSLLLIHNYFKDNLTDSQSVEFEEAMSDSAFRDELKLQSITMEGVIEHRRDNLRSLLDSAKSEMGEKSTSESTTTADTNDNNRSSRKFIILALALIGLTATVFYFLKFQENITPNTDAIFASYYNPFYVENTERGTLNNNSNQAYDEAIDLYKIQKDYAGALQKFKSIVPQSNKIKLYEANCLINIGQVEEANKLLYTIDEPLGTNLYQQIEWYKMLTDVKLSHTDKAFKTLDVITADAGHLYYLDAKKLLGEIEGTE